MNSKEAQDLLKILLGPNGANSPEMERFVKEAKKMQAEIIGEIQARLFVEYPDFKQKGKEMLTVIMHVVLLYDISREASAISLVNSIREFFMVSVEELNEITDSIIKEVNHENQKS